MATDLPSVARDILHRLLDRWEQPARKTVVRVRLNEAEHPDYFSQQKAQPRQATNSALSLMAEQGLLRLQWQKHETGNWLAAVDLAADGAPAIYQRLGRAPRMNQVAALRDLLAAQQPQAGWHAGFLGWATAKLDAHGSVAPLDLAAHETNVELLRVLEALAQLRTPTLERLFSVQVLGDSKRFSALRSKVITVLRRHAPAAADFGNDDDSLLRAFGLERVPEYVPISGPLRLSAGGRHLDLTQFAPSVALSADTLRQASVDACAAREIVTVENAANFSELANHRAELVLVVFTSGFASPTLVGLLRQVIRQGQSPVLYHWGDLDAGGLRILAHLRKHLGLVHPLGMDLATFEQRLGLSRPLTTGDRHTLALLRRAPELQDCVPLIDKMLTAGLKLEQEAVSVNQVLSQLTAGEESRR
jgi:hypothetical protein